MGNGPIVVTGPFKINGVPLRRVNPAYVIATKTKVDISAVDTSKVTNETFKRPAAAKREKGEKEFFDGRRRLRPRPRRRARPARQERRQGLGRAPRPAEVGRHGRRRRAEEGSARQGQGWLPALGLHPEAG